VAPLVVSRTAVWHLRACGMPARVACPGKARAWSCLVTRNITDMTAGYSAGENQGGTSPGTVAPTRRPASRCPGMRHRLSVLLTQKWHTCRYKAWRYVRAASLVVGHGTRRGVAVQSMHTKGRAARR
jgi:hypothetical protein